VNVAPKGVANPSQRELIAPGPAAPHLLKIPCKLTSKHVFYIECVLYRMCSLDTDARSALQLREIPSKLSPLAAALKKDAEVRGVLAHVLHCGGAHELVVALAPKQLL
jgi:hypothetical protein